MNRKAALILFVAVIAFIIIAIFYVRSNRQTNPGTAELPPPTLVQVQFDYTVKSISAESIVLNGEKGDFTLPNDSQIVKVFQGSRDNNQAGQISDLQVGQELQLDFVPGRTASIYILK